MSNSKDEDVKKSGVVLRTDVFYEPEYRELCLQQLNIFNETKMSSNYLKDLVETTHAFLKLMESMSKSKHLVVKSKKKRKPKSQKRTKNASSDLDGSNKQQDNEKMWDDVSSKLSHVLEESEIPSCDISPFDPLSEKSTDQQKLLAMINIQDFLRKGDALQSIALLRAAREVWPEQDTFGSEGADNEDDFMTLREILFAELPRPHGAESTVIESSEEPFQGNNIEPENELEEEYEDEYITYDSEREFDFKSLAMRFSVKSVCNAYALLFANYEKNSGYTNHCIIKMFHRISWDCSLPSMLFNMSIFRTFQKVHKDYQTTGITSLKELDRFGKYLLSKFFETCKTNKKVFMELFFWKTTREASEILEGYGTYVSNKSSKSSFWTEDDEESLNRIFHQLKDARAEENNETNSSDGDLLDSITAHFVSSGKSRRQVAKKLKDLHLIEDIKEVTRKPLKTKGRIWTDDEVDKLKILYEQFKDAIDPIKRIRENLSNQRTKRKIIEKILELELCANPSELKRKLGSRSRRRDELQRASTDSELDSAFDSDSDQNDKNIRSDVLLEILKSLPENVKAALVWLKEGFEENASDKNESEHDNFPLLVVDEPIVMAIENDSFKRLLHFLSILSPSDSNGSYWSIQGKETLQSLESKTSFVKKLICKVESNVDFEKKDSDDLVEVLLEHSKCKRNKWMPIRKTLDPAAQARINAENLENSVGQSTSKDCKSIKKRKPASQRRKEISKDQPKAINKTLVDHEKSSSDSESFTNDGSKQAVYSENSSSDSSANGNQNHSKKKRSKRVISSDSSSDDEETPLKDNTIKNEGEEDKSHQQEIQPYSDDENPNTSLKVKRRILDDSSSDEGVIDPYPGDEPRSFLQSSPISRLSTVTPSTLTPTSQTSRSETPTSKRCRDYSSPSNSIKKHKIVHNFK